MRIKGVVVEDFVNYKLPSMFITTAFCDFKCEKDFGTMCCQNRGLQKALHLTVTDDSLIRKYIQNPITRAIVFGGLEPFDQKEELIAFLSKLRDEYMCSDPVVIYTGYNKSEIIGTLSEIKTRFKNIIVKFGRFIPGSEEHYDDLLGVYLASPNQYAEKIC